MATGKPCWSQQYQEVAALFHIGTTKSHPSIPEHLSLELKDFIPKCLQKEPHLRSGASELLQHLFVTGKYQETHPACRTLAMIGKPGVYSMPKPMQQNLHSVNIFADLSISQYLTTDHHPCSQQTLPLENYANMVGYPFLSEIYTYMPSTFKQAYACSSSAYNQSPTALRDCPGISYTLPQCKYVGSGSSLSQSAVVASGYGGGFRCMSGSFLLNRLASCEIETITGGDDLLRSQHKDANDFAMPIQKESCAMWVHGGPGASRETGSVLLASAYYNFLGKNQTASGGWLTPVFATS